MTLSSTGDYSTAVAAWSPIIPWTVNRSIVGRVSSPLQHSQSGNSSNSSSPSLSPINNKTTGKRFVRRAKRWAELQQRRSGSVSEGLSFSPIPHQLMQYQMPEPLQGLETYIYPIPGPAPFHCKLNERYEKNGAPLPSQVKAHSHLAPSRSLPYPLHTSMSPSASGVRTYELGKRETISITEGINEYGHRTQILVYRTPSIITVYPRHRSTPILQQQLQQVQPQQKEWSLGSNGSSNYSPGSSTANHSLNSSIDNEESDEYVHSDPPPDRTWMMIRHADPERPIATFTVLNYNVLSNKYASQNIYSYCPSWALNWNYRKSAIIKEIRNYEADVITLQEVETQEYKMLFKPEMSALGYSSIFQAKSRAKTMHEEDRKFVDGCAIFWKNDKFDLAREQLIEFNRVAISKCSANENMLNRVQPRDNIALCAVLKIKESVYNNRNVLSRPMPPSDNVVGSPLIVCTAHIHWDPEFCDVKLVQTMMLTHELWKLVEEVAESHRIQPHQVPTLICGDLNSLPDSGVFEFISKSGISRSHPDLKAFKEDAVLEKFSHSHDGSNYTHALRLDSAVENAVVPFTNFTMEFKGMIDYIFSTPQSLARLGVLGPFDMDYINANKIIGFPHAHVPSDHIPIMAQYALIPTNHQRPQPQIQHFGNQHSGPFGAVGR